MRKLSGSRSVARAAVALTLVLGACRHETEIAATDGGAEVGDGGADGADGREAGPLCVLGGTSAIIPAIVSCGPGLPTRLALDDENVYWTDQRRGAVVFKAPRAGGGPIVLVYDDSPAVGLAVDATYVYYTQPGRNRVMRVPIAGGPALVVAGGLDSPNYLGLGDAPDGPSLYWTGGKVLGMGTITRMALAQGAKPETLIDGQQMPRALAVADGFVYWTDLHDGEILRAPDHLDPDTSIRVATRLAANLKLPTDLVLARGYAYVPDAAGRIARVPLDGGAVETVTDIVGAPFGIATDGAFVYWTTMGRGGIFKALLGANVSATTIVDGEPEARFLVASLDDVYWGTWGGGGTVRRIATTAHVVDAK